MGKCYFGHASFNFSETYSNLLSTSTGQPSATSKTVYNEEFAGRYLFLRTFKSVILPCPGHSNIIFNRNFAKFADNKDRHKTSYDVKNYLTLECGG